MELWPHQTRTLEEIKRCRLLGTRRLCVQGNTGGGKTMIFLTLAVREAADGGRVVVYTNRRTLRAQLSDVFEDRGVYHGIRAAGHQPALLSNIQISSIMTERTRSLGKNPKWQLHDATLVIVDEVHLQKAKVAREILERHYGDGAFIVGFTATPVGLAGIMDEMIRMATLEELREGGFLVPCEVYAPWEIDMRGVPVQSGEWHQGKAAKRVREYTVIGDVIDHWQRLNPLEKPSVLFAPGVPESRWFQQQFTMFGVPAEHVDARTSEKKRSEIFDRWRAGQTKIVCNYGILREGFDFAACEHAILCQPTKKVSTYLQMVGRILRAHPGKSRAILQDHTGAYWRLGSPNEDRDWRLDGPDHPIRERSHVRRCRLCGEVRGSGDTCQSCHEDDTIPHACPKCGCVRYDIEGWRGGPCPKCGHECQGVVRKVMKANGELTLVEGDTERNPQETKRQLIDIFISCVYAAARSDRTAGAAVMMCKKRTGIMVTDEDFKTISVPNPWEDAWKRPARDVWRWAT